MRHGFGMADDAIPSPGWIQRAIRRTPSSSALFQRRQRLRLDDCGLVMKAGAQRC
jgi:hypothetical protein